MDIPVFQDHLVTAVTRGLESLDIPVPGQVDIQGTAEQGVEEGSQATQDLADQVVTRGFVA